jgi:glutamate/tyrosine decarboxylase-like PLP-dependent enzyme
MERFYTGPFEGPPTIKPPALPGDIYCRHIGILKQSLTLTPDYLATPEGKANNLMDTGIQLSRRFRALKLWMVLRYFGASGIRARIKEHVRLASNSLAGWMPIPILNSPLRLPEVLSAFARFPPRCNKFYRNWTH